MEPQHNHRMRPRRLSIPDARGQGATLTVTRHPEQRKIVLSHWRDGLCVASTPVDVTELAALIGVLADALGDAVDAPTQPVADSPQRPSLLSSIRKWIRPKLARVGELRLVGEPTEHTKVAQQPRETAHEHRGHPAF